MALRVYDIGHREPIAQVDRLIGLIGLIDLARPAASAQYGRSDVLEALPEQHVSTDSARRFEREAQWFPRP